MNRKVFVAAISMLFFAIGFAAPAGAQGTGQGTPVITQAFAAKEVRPGEPWKIYLNASDPNGLR
jgi:hypothetical protein